MHHESSLVLLRGAACRWCLLTGRTHAGMQQSDSDIGYGRTHGEEPRLIVMLELCACCDDKTSQFTTTRRVNSANGEHTWGTKGRFPTVQPALKPDGGTRLCHMQSQSVAPACVSTLFTSSTSVSTQLRSLASVITGACPKQACKNTSVEKFCHSFAFSFLYC